jgi:CheY-specific phosphatase CheX
MLHFKEEGNVMSSSPGDALSQVLQRVIRMIFGIEANVVERRVEDDRRAPFEVSGIIGMTGATQGSIVISFPMEVAQHLTALMFREHLPANCTQQDIADCVGEICNIVAGNMLPFLDTEGMDSTQISLPSVVIGSHKVVWGTKDNPCDLMFLESKLGRFAAETNLRESDSPCSGEQDVSAPTCR